MTTNSSPSLSIAITPERRDAFRQFISTLPRLCSPTICGIVNNFDQNNQNVTESISCNIEPMDITTLQQMETSQNESKFKWSIDEYAELYGGDFDNVDELDRFHQYESEHFTHDLEKFFNQKSINPSPIQPVKASSLLSSTSNWSRSDNQNENSSRSTGSFVRYIESLQSTISTSINEELENYSVDDKDTQSLSITPKKNSQKRTSFNDSDFVSMDISMSTPVVTNHSKQNPVLESNNIQTNYSKYLDFSPISPISTRTPLSSLNGIGNKSQIKRFPMSSFGIHMSNDDFDNISPIVPISAKQSRFASNRININKNKGTFNSRLF
ncbi:hypothetical protein RDWZM_001170 [Blomia tropicalis]|uniref:Uncharacterized protein n=1 Tax=Blomia tropicalis TaxID=40697 RepID=A0A9Q0RQH3_BLOTA|nr:hypothetical protein BLOT_007075 [Blomia tropicalis]KAJ6222625.1 hypothetical protein RDWZM_001170 [Blomia tropicalis]